MYWSLCWNLRSNSNLRKLNHEYLKKNCRIATTLSLILAKRSILGSRWSYGKKRRKIYCSVGIILERWIRVRFSLFWSALCFHTVVFGINDVSLLFFYKTSTWFNDPLLGQDKAWSIKNFTISTFKKFFSTVCLICINMFYD